MAIAGLPPLNGFASEWLTLQALLHVSAYGHVADGIAGAIALAALAATAALARVLLRQGRRARAARRRRAARQWPKPRRRHGRCAGAVAFLALACVVLGLAPGLLFGPLVGLAPWPATEPTGIGLHLPGTGSLPTGGIALVLVALTAGLVLLRGRRSAAPAPSWACGQRVEPALHWTSAGFTKPLRLVLEVDAPPAARDRRPQRGRRSSRSVSYRGRVPHLIDERVYRPVVASLAGVRGPRPAAAERQPRDLRRLPHRARRRPARSRADRGDRMNAGTAAAGAVQIAGGILLAPLLPGLVQHWKARLQGRRGPSPLQPYRELRRLWGKSAVSVEGTSAVYRLAPAVVAASLAAAVLLVPAPSAHRTGASATTRSRSRASSRSLASRSLPRRLGRVERLLADGREPRPDSRGLRRGNADPLAGRRGARRQLRPTSRASSPGPPGQPSGRAPRSRSARSPSPSS